MRLIDTHTHLETFAQRGGIQSTLNRARDAGIGAMVTIGTSLDDWELYHGLAVSHPGLVYYSAGLHPCAVEENWADSVSQLEWFWTRANKTMGGSVAPVALGEIGLDRFHLPKNDEAAAQRIFGWQQSAFVEGLRMAKRIGCPVVIHSRGAFTECVRMIDDSGVDWTKVVFHCFTEGEVEMAELIKRGGWASFTGIITYKTADAVRAAAKTQGLSRLMIETDAPYLTPMPHRGKPNEPAFLRHTAEFTAEKVFGVRLEELASVTTANADRFFGLANPN
ncbi:MAG: TatD family hydrolase [Opitutus sp.]